MAQLVKNLLAVQRPGFSPGVGKITWRRKWQPTPVSLSGKSHGQRSLVGYSPWGRKKSGTTEQLTLTRRAGFPKTHIRRTLPHVLLNQVPTSLLSMLFGNINTLSG